MSQGTPKIETMAQMLASSDRGARYYKPGTPDPIDPGETAHDGQAVAQKRPLTARERDVLVRVINFVLSDERYRFEEIYTLVAIREAIDPRTD